MRLSAPNIIMHKSIIWLQQHRKQHPTLTFTIYSMSEKHRRKSLRTCTAKGQQIKIISTVLMQRLWGKMIPLRIHPPILLKPETEFYLLTRKTFLKVIVYYPKAFCAIQCLLLHLKLLQNTSGCLHHPLEPKVLQRQLSTDVKCVVYS